MQTHVSTHNAQLTTTHNNSQQEKYIELQEENVEKKRLVSLLDWKLFRQPLCIITKQSIQMIRLIETLKPRIGVIG